MEKVLNSLNARSSMPTIATLDVARQPVRQQTRRASATGIPNRSRPGAKRAQVAQQHAGEDMNTAASNIGREKRSPSTRNHLRLDVMPDAPSARYSDPIEGTRLRTKRVHCVLH